MTKQHARILTALLLALILATLPVAALAADGSAQVTFSDVNYTLTYVGAKITDKGLTVTVQGDSLPIVNGQAQLPAIVAVDVGGAREMPQEASIGMANGVILYDFLFASDAQPDAVWLYPGGNENEAVLLWGDAAEAASAPVEESSQGFKVMTFGRYEQDNNPSNGPEPIEWLVLKSDGETATLISRYGLDAIPYNDSRADVTWETCSLRRWLNSRFMHTAFTEEEQRRLVSTAVAADANPDYDTDPGNATHDRVFLLSIREANEYFPTDVSRGCERTAYAKAQGAETWTDNLFGWWWLRSPGQESGSAAMVDYECEIVSRGVDVSDEKRALRPVITLRLSEAEDAAFVKPSGEAYDARSIVSFGHYEQDNDPENGPEPIEWLVLANDWETATLISVDVLDSKPFNTEYAETTWEDSLLRQWLNDDFLNAAFSEEEQACLVTTTVTADRNPDHEKRDPGADTQDRVFVLSVPECEALFDSSSMRISSPTEYAVAQGVMDYTSSEGTEWRLRTPGYILENTSQVTYFGSIDTHGDNVNSRLCGVRPMIVLQLFNEGPRPTPTPVPTPSPTPEIVYPTLQKGAKGDDVVKLQQALIDGGWLKGSADGDFGKKTETAVRDAQQAMDQEVTGIADDAFQKALYGN